MVLADLGRQLNAALTNLTKAPVIDKAVLDDLLKSICSALLSADVNVALVMKLRENVKKTVDLDDLSNSVNKRRVIEKAVMDELYGLVDPGVEAFRPKKHKQNVIMMVGLQGAGKTTTCTKLAAFYVRKGFKTALVCADTFRAGAYDQLKQNATKAKIPYYGSYSETDPVSIALEGVSKFKKEKFEVIIVDTSGRHKQETELFEEMKQISSAVEPDSTIFVMDGAIGQAADGQARAFKEAANFGSIVITKMDGHAKGGGAISAVAATKSPIVFIGTGEHLHDIERFEPKGFIRKMMGMGDMQGLVETVQDMSRKTNPALMENVAKGKYTLRDMYEQIQQLSQVGPLSKFMGSMPGMTEKMGEDGTKQVKRMMCIMDSMSDKELDGVATVDHSRMVRIARGSGTSVHDVEQILQQCNQFAGMAKSLAPMMNTTGGKNTRQNMLGAAGRGAGGMPNMNQMAAAMRQMGLGGAGMPNMNQMADAMRQMGLGGEGGMPDMGALMRMMGGGK